jgi:very-short-patch-repair endonuclease
MDQKLISVLQDEYNIKKHEIDNIILFKAKDIGSLLEIKKITKTLENIDEKDKILLNSVTNGSKRNQYFLTVNGVLQVLAITRKVKSIEIKEKIGLTNDAYRPNIKESSFIKLLLKAFDGENIMLQYKVDNYFIDAYFCEYNLAIEFDEKYHNLYKQNDEKRQEYIKDKLDCHFIRVSENDDFISSINTIFKYIKSRLQIKYETERLKLLNI